MRQRVLLGAALVCAIATGGFGGDKASMKPLHGRPLPKRWLPVDQDGWTVLEPAGDSRIVYVSSSEGDDATARAYQAGEPSVGADPRLPAEPVRAFKTVGAALEHAREGAPDWVLFRRGDEFMRVRIKARSGRSAQAPSVIGAYGSAADRPAFKGHGIGVSFGRVNTGAQFAVLMDLVFHATCLDPDSPDYQPDKRTHPKGDHGGIGIEGGAQAQAQNILVENCLLRFCGLTCCGFSPDAMADVVIRRCAVLDKYTLAGHTQGLWGAHASLLLEECLFDHCGWLHQNVPENKGKPGLANPLSHNTYCLNMRYTVFRDNIFMRGASIHNKFTAKPGAASVRHVVLDNNLYLDGEIGISMGGNVPGPLRWVDCRIVNNVMTDLGRSRPTGRILGWGMGISDWDGGLVANNLIHHFGDEEVRMVQGIQIRAGAEDANLKRRKVEKTPGPWCRNLTVRDNVIHGLRSARFGALVVDTTRAEFENVRIERNHIQMPGLSTRTIDLLDKERSGVRFSGNTYYTDADPGAWFLVNGEKKGFADWVAYSGEQDAKNGKIAYPDPVRDIEGYMKHLGKEPTYAAFIEEARRQCKANWRPEFAAPAINHWFRAGFGVKKMPESKAAQ
ncbi:MAG: hypothetical protein JXR37_16140 [Kiritimatiellae bacterium]|nr:hypothetical protein [Kiritimatiellia bacterium]